MKPATAPTLPAPEPRSSARLGYLIYRVERLLRARLDESVRDHGVTTTEYVTLSVLRHHDGLSCAQLARWAYVTPQAMNLVISALERRRLVRRRPDPANRRVLRASVTPKGLDVLDGCDESMDAIEADMVRDLTEAEDEVMHELLARSVRSLEATARMTQPRALRAARKRAS